VALTVEVNRDLLSREDFAPYFEHLARMDPVVFVRTLDSMANHTAWDHLPHVDVPTLIVAGERDNFTPSRLSRKMAERIPGAELMLVPLGTHTTPLEYKDLVELRVERFLRDRLGVQLPPLPRLVPGEGASQP
jgi:pimeloyl-ACP methyl ester carboxylesterase